MAATSSDAGAVEAQVSYAACHQALDTAELLEEILTHLPTKDLLFAQKICRQWKNCIDNSKRLQQGLFFRPSGDRAAVDFVQIYLDGLALKFKGDSEAKADMSFLKFMTINPLVLSEFGAHGLSSSTTHPDDLCRSDEAYLRPEASWKRMLRSYPVFKTNDDGLTNLIEAYWARHLPGGPMFPKLAADSRVLVENGICRALTNLYSSIRECETTADLELYWAAAKRAESKESN